MIDFLFDCILTVQLPHSLSLFIGLFLKILMRGPNDVGTTGNQTLQRIDQADAD